jgi:hypothetical protein
MTGRNHRTRPDQMTAMGPCRCRGRLDVCRSRTGQVAEHLAAERAANLHEPFQSAFIWRMSPAPQILNAENQQSRQDVIPLLYCHCCVQLLLASRADATAQNPR